MIGPLLMISRFATNQTFKQIFANIHTYIAQEHITLIQVTFPAA